MNKRYDPSQPRVPAGSSKGGQWMKREEAEKIYNTVYPNDLNVSQRAKEEKHKKTTEGGIGIEIDGLTPCLRRLSDGAIVETEFVEVHPKKKSDFPGWEFNWSKPEKEGCSVYALKAKGDDRIQGLVAMRSDPKNNAYFINIVEAAPFNNKHNKSFIKKEYEGVGGHLFAEAARRSKEEGFGGAVWFAAKTNLIEHYISELGAEVTNRLFGYMKIEGESSENLIKKYYGVKK